MQKNYVRMGLEETLLGVHDNKVKILFTEVSAVD